MKKIIKLKSLVAIFVLFSSFLKLDHEKLDVNQGNVIYEYKEGKMQCQSEIDPSGQIAILIKGLTDNTEVSFVKLNRPSNIVTNEQKMEIVILMVVEERNPICAKWIDMKEVTIVIDPLTVSTITLKGNTISKNGNVSILSPLP